MGFEPTASANGTVIIATISSALTFNSHKVMAENDRHVMSGNLSRTLSEEGNIPGYVIVEYIQGDGVSTLTFSADFFLKGDISNGDILTSDITYRVTMMYNGSKVDTIVAELDIAAI